jgi:hypothetical protein
MAKKTMSPLDFTRIWNIIIDKGEKHPDGGYVYHNVRTMVTPGNNRKLYSLLDGTSHVEIGNTIRVYGAKK